MQYTLVYIICNNSVYVIYCTCICLGVMSVSSPTVSKSNLRTIRNDKQLRPKHSSAATLLRLRVNVFACTVCVGLALVDLTLVATSADTACHVLPSRAAHHILLFMCVFVCVSDISKPNNSSGLCPQ